MSKIDFSEPQRMSAGAFFILFAKIFKQLLAAVVTLAFYNLLSSSKITKFGVWLIILLSLGLCIVLTLILTAISFFPKRFYIKDGNLIFIHGLINRENTVVPLDRVHSLRTEKGIWFRLLDMRGIIFDTLATRHEEIELILSESDWQALLSLIEKEEKPKPDSPYEPPEYNPSTTVSYPVGDLLKAALCQNHLKGMAVFGSIFAVIFSNLDDISEDDTLTAAGYLETFFDSLIASPLQIAILLVSLYIIILLFWLGRVLLRYYDMTMKYDKKLLTFTYGLLTRASCRFFYDKICTIRIKRNYLEKRFGFCTLMLRQALNASAQKEDDNMKLYGTDSSSFFLNWWLGDDYNTLPDIITAKSGRGVLIHSMLPSLLIIAVLAIVFCCNQMYLWLFVPLLWLFIAVWRGICAMRHSRITLKSSYFIIHNGAFAEITNYIKYSNLEVVKIRRTPLTRFFHRVAIMLSTSGTTFYVRSIREDEARLIYEYLLFKAEEPRCDSPEEEEIETDVQYPEIEQSPEENNL